MNRLQSLLACGISVLATGACAQSNFQNYYAYPGFTVTATAVTQLPSGQIAIGGQVVEEQGNQQDAIVLLLNGNGTLVWAKKLDADQQAEVLVDLTAASNGKLLVLLGKVAASTGLTGIIQLDLNGKIEWSKRFPAALDTYTSNNKLTSGYLLCGSNLNGLDLQGLLVKLDGNGQEIWRKLVHQPGSSIVFRQAWEDSQGFIYAVGSIDQNDGVLSKWNAAGNLAWIRRLGTTDHDVLDFIIPMSNDQLLLGGTSIGFDQYLKGWLTRIDLSGTVKWSSTFGQPSEDLTITGLAASGSNPVFCISGTGASPNLGAGLGRINESGDLLWIKEYDPAGQFALSARLSPGVNNGFILNASLQTSAGRGFYVVRSDANGDVPPCCFKSGNLTVTDITIGNQVFVPDVTAALGLLQAGTWTAVAFQPEQGSLCNPPPVEIALSDSIICPGECIDVSIVDPGPGVTYAWSYPGGVKDPQNPNRVCFPGGSSDVLISLVANGCLFQKDTALLRVDATEEQVPNAFTPNNDDTNDQFLPRLYCPLPGYHFLVYNRWGEIMFETFDPVQGWDGTFNGLDAPLDTYAWVIEYSANPNGTGTPATIMKKGSVTLLR